MKKALPPEIEAGRTTSGYFRTNPGEMQGHFKVMHPRTGRELTLIVSDGTGWQDADPPLPLPVWEHVSVSAAYGLPLYDEMHWVKQQFWEPTECVLEFHVPESDHINVNPNVLHLWRPVGVEIPLPPKECV